LPDAARPSLGRWQALRFPGPGGSLLRRLVSKSPRVLALGVATAVAQSFLLVPIALLVRRVFDTNVPGDDTGAIVRDGVLILVLYGLAAMFGYVARAFVLRTTTEVASHMRDELLDKLYALPQSWHDRQEAGRVQSILVRDTEQVELTLADLANPLLPAAIVSVVLVVLALILSPTLFLVVLTILPALAFVGHRLAVRSRRQAQNWHEAWRDFSADTQLMLRAMTLTKAEGAENWEVARRRRLVRQLSSRSRALGEARSAHTAMQSALGAVAGSAVLVAGGLSVADGSMTIGELLGFYAVLALLIRQLQALGPGSANAVLGLDSMARVESLLAEPMEPVYPGDGRGIEYSGRLQIEDVSFAYDERVVLRNIDIAVEPSEHVAIVGPNGAGKSTLVSLILGLYRPQSGRLMADGLPYEDLDMRALRRQIGVVLQDPVLFPGTIRENIAYGRPDAGDAAIAAAADVATAAAFVERLPDGYDTRVGDEGVGLSGGQRQRIAIARALLGEPGLLVLDEPTTYLDEAGAAALIAKLDGLPRAPTLVLVTHDPRVAAQAGRVIELRDGRIVGDRVAALPGT
jgi:ATP-binding cassette subfamily B protein